MAVSLQRGTEEEFKPVLCWCYTYMVHLLKIRERKVQKLRAKHDVDFLASKIWALKDRALHFSF